jgi:hypothetical protein
MGREKACQTKGISGLDTAEWSHFVNHYGVFTQAENYLFCIG